MTLFIAAIVIFFAIHLVPTMADLRGRLITQFGKPNYRVSFAVLSTASLILLIYAFAKAPVVTVWSPPPWTRWVAIVLMWPAFIFMVAAFVPGKIKARVKFPFLVAVKTWALAHLIANGDLASIILFASFLAYAVYDRISLKTGRQPTSLIGFEGPAKPLNDAVVIVFGTVLYVLVLLWLHKLVIGVAPLPQ
ncbi:MAG: NnrU family protein [Actinomycetota bacterium]